MAGQSLIEGDCAIEDVQHAVGRLRAGERSVMSDDGKEAESTDRGFHIKWLLTSFIPVRRTEPSTRTRAQSGASLSPSTAVKDTFLVGRSVLYSTADAREIGACCERAQLSTRRLSEL